MRTINHTFKSWYESYCLVYVHTGITLGEYFIDGFYDEELHCGCRLFRALQINKVESSQKEYIEHIISKYDIDTDNMNTIPRKFTDPKIDVFKRTL